MLLVRLLFKASLRTLDVADDEDVEGGSGRTANVVLGGYLK